MNEALKFINDVRSDYVYQEPKIPPFINMQKYFLLEEVLKLIPTTVIYPLFSKVRFCFDRNEHLLHRGA